VAREGNIPLATDLKVFRKVNDLLEFGRENRLEGYGMILPEYEILRRAELGLKNCCFAFF
jgi:hypothetical protein